MARAAPPRFALAFSVHTGHAVALAAGGSLLAPRIELRATVELLEKKRAFLFHAAAGQPVFGEETKRAQPIDLTAARALIAQASGQSQARAAQAIGAMREAVANLGGQVIGCAIVANTGELLPLAEIVGAHPRIHAAEGLFYRDALLAGARTNGLRARVFPAKTLLAAAADALGERSEVLDSLLASAGKLAGRPWSRDQKLAALAGWSLLAE